ncbi:Cox20/FAM36A [Cordyceps fumosorosea ARSEF 2679]|uniref:Cytochrome c oxidase assembly protein COX20, mitochondrial n=1 Tax=Cordyceps fumosorosea (strain ARSEF 2679) TaxID=1081104 RepID=A0A162MHB2_CORFA|nr:Cox20/FAM36A [Cordyceps fumosorosea ARSEF 2679]OAA56060.1 Cox20/FAM36A [Cordyceps fumosorosea ARSEF 2679]
MAGDDQPNAPQGLTLPTSVSGKPVQAAWSAPLRPADDPSSGNASASTSKRPTIADAVASIKSEDFAKVANTPCSRNGFMTGIVTGAAAGGLKLVVRANWVGAANWAVGMFVVGATASYEYCQYSRRVEKRNMKRAVEVHAENQRMQAKKMAEQRERAKKLEEERKAAERRWYKFW